MINAVIMAGGGRDNNSKRAHPMLSETAGKLTLCWVVETLKKTPNIDRIAVLGPRDRLERIVDVPIIDEIGNLPENGLRAAEYFKGGKILYSGWDIPLANPEHYQRVIDKCDFRKGDFFFPVVDMKYINPKLPEGYKLPSLRISDHNGNKKRIRVGNLVLVDTDNVFNFRILEEFYEVRALRFWKNVIKAGLKEWKVVGKWTINRLDYNYVEERASKSLNTRFKLIESEDPEIALDVDYLEEIDIINKMMMEKLGI